MKKHKLSTFIFLIFLLSNSLFGQQKVGLVLSGGGAKGMAHVGVIKALEEQGIPIDYIAGTSMGAIVGGLYASGYSVEEMEEIFSNKEFSSWIEGKIHEDYTYFFRKENPNSAWIKLNFEMDSTRFSPILPVNFIAPTQMDFAFVEIYSQAEAAAQYNFDSLFVPFRCVATDITNGKEKVFSNGSLKDAIRASMTFPFYFRPIMIDSCMMYDGGMVNNFPTDVMQNDFQPDYIIAVAVAKHGVAPSDENIISILNSMLVDYQTYTVDTTHAILIRPNVPKLNVTDFTKGRQLVSVGYQTLMDSLPSIRKHITDSVPAEVVQQRRQKFREKWPTVQIKNITARGINRSQVNVIENYIFKKNEIIDFHTFKERYFKLTSEEYINHIYPTLYLDSGSNYYNAVLQIDLSKPFQFQFGGYVSTNAQTTLYLQLKYNFWKRYFMSTYIDAYFGRYYNSIAATFRLNSLSNIQFDQEVKIGYSFWNYFNNSKIFIDSDNPSFLSIGEFLIKYTFSAPINRHGKFGFKVNVGNSKARFYPSNNYNKNDVFDINTITCLQPQVFFEYNTQDVKYFPTKGNRIYSTIGYFAGFEQNVPGTTSVDTTKITKFRHWFVFNLEAEKIFNFSSHYRLGLSANFAWSNLPKLESYTATKLRCSAFLPNHETVLQYLPSYRDPAFLTVGLENIVPIYKKLQFRLEAYFYQPIFAVLRNNENKSYFSKAFEMREFIIYSSLAYTTKFGPISINLSYYSNNAPKWFFNISFGYLFFNDKIF